ncbi:MAG TPA: alpha-amylase family glycosyl hydrolase, partial [Acidobacteriota bacterium]|nr:alpha-amylase family glycosyl hydrolase [Acidobacteriota bacterium]
VSVGQTSASPYGNYLFCDLLLTPEATAGTVELEITADSTTIQKSWPLFSPLPREGNYQGLLPSDIVYLIMPDRFADGDPSNNEPAGPGQTYNPRESRMYHGGDLRGVIQHLDYLKELGVTAIWLTPVYDNTDTKGDVYHGYHMTDFFDVEEHFGTLALYQELTREVHKRGMKLIQDIVPNHSGPDHDWVKNPPSKTWYNGTLQKHLDCSFDTPVLLDPKTPKKTRRLVTEGWFAGTLPDLNTLDARYRTYSLQNTLWWLNMTGQDALRIDTYPYVERAFWRDWQKGLDAEFPTVTDFGEVLVGDPKVVSFFKGGKTGWDGIDTGLKSVFDFPLAFAIREFCADDTKDSSRITDILAQDALYGDASSLVTLINNHDVSRLIQDAKGDSRRLRLAHAILLTLRGVPQLYYGDEIGMMGGNDPDNRRDFPGGFGGSINAFDPAQRTAEQAAIWNDLQHLLALRRSHPTLQTGQHTNLLVKGRSLAYIRSDAKEKLLIVLNGKSADDRLQISLSPQLPKGSKLTPIA